MGERHRGSSDGTNQKHGAQDPPSAADPQTHTLTRAERATPRNSDTLGADDPGLAETQASELGSETTAAATPGPLGPAATNRAEKRARYGRYELLCELGSGGMGVVYEAYDPELDRKVALKVIGQSQRKLGTLGRERLIREARAMAKLAHPNVIAIHDVGSVGDEAFVAMELVHGCTLKDWLREQSPSHGELLDVFAQAGRGLAAAHAAGLVHRDFKPSNVMVDDDGRVRVLDFGLARTVEPGQKEAGGRTASDGSAPLGALTHTGAVIGTPAYMAPEQYQAGQVDARTDQFSFCVALYEALYDASPFSGASIEQRAESVTSGNVRPPPASKVISQTLRDAVLRGLQPDPGDRNQSMTDVLRALGPTADISRTRKNRIATALIVATAVVGGGLAVSAMRNGSAKQAGDRPAMETARNAALHMQMVDSESPLMEKLAAHVNEDVEARRLGVRSATVSWETSSPTRTFTEHYLVASDRQNLATYLSRISRARPTLAPEAGHEILHEHVDGLWRTHYLWTRVELDGAAIREATVRRNDRSGDPEVLVRFTDQGAARLAATTGQNVGRRLATVVHGTVTAAPVITAPILGGSVSLSVDGPDQATKQREAVRLARDMAPR